MLDQLARDPAIRFAIALVLKALVHGADLIGLDTRAWCGALARTETCDLVARHRTHPGEMIARHSGELLRGKHAAAARWFELGVAIGTAGGPTLRQISRFTQRLAEGRDADSAAPRGSVFNPCYEYR